MKDIRSLAGNPLQEDLDAQGHSINNVKTLMAVRNAAQFPGDDIGEKINNAIADLPTDSGGIKRGKVIIPVGEYNFSTTINLTEGVILEGQQMQRPCLVYTGTGTAIRISGSAESPLWGWEIRHIKLTGQDTAGTIGIKASYAPYGRMANVAITDFAIGLEMDNSYVCNFSNVYISSCTSIGAKLLEASNATTWRGCHVGHCENGIILYEKLTGFYWYGGTIEGNTDRGLTINYGTNGSIEHVVIDGLYMEDNGRDTGGSHIQIGAGSGTYLPRQITLKDIVFTSGDYGINVGGSYGVCIERPYFKGTWNNKKINIFSSNASQCRVFMPSGVDYATDVTIDAGAEVIYWEDSGGIAVLKRGIVDFGGQNIRGIANLHTVSLPMQEIAAQSAVEISPVIPTNEGWSKIKIWAFGVTDSAHYSQAYLKAEVYNMTDATSEWSSSGYYTEGTPVTTIDLVADKKYVLRIQNTDTSSHTATGFITFSVE